MADQQLPVEMPNHYWPRSVTVVGEGWDGSKLAFELTQEEFEDNLVTLLFAQRLANLRHRLWEAAR